MKKTSKKKTDTKKHSARYEFINSSGGNKKLREKIWDFCTKHDIQLKMFEPGCFDGGIIRFGKKKDGLVVVYDYEKTAEALAEDYLAFNNSRPDTDKDKVADYDFDAAYLDAVEWLDYNTIRSIPYMAPYAPKMVYEDDDGVEQEV